MNPYKLTQPSEIASLLEGLLLEATSIIANTPTTLSKADLCAAQENIRKFRAVACTGMLLAIISLQTNRTFINLGYEN